MWEESAPHAAGSARRLFAVRNSASGGGVRDQDQRTFVSSPLSWRVAIPLAQRLLTRWRSCAFG